ncbi:MAG: alkaline phosphatase family protein [Vicinamibacterales bacterium]
MAVHLPSVHKTDLLTRALACLGLANFLLLSEWQSLYIVYNRDLSYFASVKYPLTYVWSTVLTVVLVGVGLTAASTLLERVRRSCRTSAIDRLVLALNAFVIIAVWMCGSVLLASPRTRFGIAAGMLAVAVTCVARLPKAVALASGSRLLAWTALFFPVVFGTTLLKSTNYRLVAPVQASQSGSTESSPNRLVWIVLDEFDPTVAFDRRPGDVQLRALDRLRSESFVATNAYAPGSWTLDALPTLWTGRPVSEAREVGPSDLRLTFVGVDGQHLLAASDTVFAQAHAAGFKVGIAGWYHPYCRLFGHVAEQCESVSSSDSVLAFRRAEFAAERGTLAMVPLLVRWRAPWSFEALATGGLVRARAEAEKTRTLLERAETYRLVHARTLAMVQDRSLALVFAHYPVPHLPGFYDSNRGEIDITTSHGYENNLALADRAVGELRRALEEAGLWAGTTVLVHSDHALRPRIWKQLQQWTPELEASTGGRQSAFTPFILKLPGQDKGIEYDRPFNAALARDLVMAALDGRLGSAAEVTKWLDANRHRVPLSWPVRTLLDR